MYIKPFTSYITFVALDLPGGSKKQLDPPLFLNLSYREHLKKDSTLTYPRTVRTGLIFKLPQCDIRVRDQESHRFIIITGLIFKLPPFDITVRDKGHILLVYYNNGTDFQATSI